MEYRLVKKDDKILVYEEENSQQICHIQSSSHYIFFRKYKMEFEDMSVEIRPGIFTRRRWKVGDVLIAFKWRLLGNGVAVQHGSKKYRSKGFEEGKLKLKEFDQGRTGLVIHKDQLVSDDSVLVEHYDRFSLIVTLITTVLCMRRLANW